MNRRQFLQRSLAAGTAASVGVGLYTWRVEPHWLQFVERTLPIAGLPADLDGRLLVQLSDLHVGPQVDDRYIIHALDRTAELRPDFVIFTGDFVTYDADNTAPRLAAVLRHFPHGRNGTVAILGNHDYGPGWSQPDLAARIAQVASNAGIRLQRA